MAQQPNLIHPSLAPIQSSMASHAAYDEKAQSLMVRFHNGSTFRYDDIAPNIGHTMMGAQSFGSGFNRHIAGKRTGVKL